MHSKFFWSAVALLLLLSAAHAQTDSDASDPSGTTPSEEEAGDQTDPRAYERVRNHEVYDKNGRLIVRQQQQYERTDARNWSREQTITLRDGRTIEMQRSHTWDGTTHTMQNSVTGPNGQTRQVEQSHTREAAESTTDSSGPFGGFFGRLFGNRPQQHPGRQGHSGFSLGASRRAKALGRASGLRNNSPGRQRAFPTGPRAGRPDFVQPRGTGRPASLPPHRGR